MKCWLPRNFFWLRILGNLSIIYTSDPRIYRLILHFFICHIILFLPYHIYHEMSFSITYFCHLLYILSRLAQNCLYFSWITYFFFTLQTLIIFHFLMTFTRYELSWDPKKDVNCLCISAYAISSVNLIVLSFNGKLSKRSMKWCEFHWRTRKTPLETWYKNSL